MSARERIRVVQAPLDIPGAFAFKAMLEGREVGEIYARLTRRGGVSFYGVTFVHTIHTMRRQGIATALYEAAAREACRRGFVLGSTNRDPGAHSHDFWSKQLSAGRAIAIGGAWNRRRDPDPDYVLRDELCPSPLLANSGGEVAESREFMADWLRQAPEFMAELGMSEHRLGPRGEKLRWLGSGGRAVVVDIGMLDGVRCALKVTNDPAQAMLSQAAMEDEPIGVVPVYAVVETDIPDRTGKGPTWGIVEKVLVPVMNLESLDEHERHTLRGLGEDPLVLLDRFWVAMEAWRAGAPPKLTGAARRKKVSPLSDPLAEEWRLQIAAAVEWLEEVYPYKERVVKRLDFHDYNFGIDPDTGDLVLLDLGQG